MVVDQCSAFVGEQAGTSTGDCHPDWRALYAIDHCVQLGCRGLQVIRNLSVDLSRAHVKQWQVRAAKTNLGSSQLQWEWRLGRRGHRRREFLAKNRNQRSRGDRPWPKTCGINNRLIVSFRAGGKVYRHQEIPLWRSRVRESDCCATDALKPDTIERAKGNRQLSRCRCHCRRHRSNSAIPRCSGESYW